MFDRKTDDSSLFVHDLVAVFSERSAVHVVDVVSNHVVNGTTQFHMNGTHKEGGGGIVVDSHLASMNHRDRSPIVALGTEHDGDLVPKKLKSRHSSNNLVSLRSDSTHSTEPASKRLKSRNSSDNLAALCGERSFSSGDSMEPEFVIRLHYHSQCKQCALDIGLTNEIDQRELLHAIEESIEAASQRCIEKYGEGAFKGNLVTTLNPSFVQKSPNAEQLLKLLPSLKILVGTPEKHHLTRG